MNNLLHSVLACSICILLFCNVATAKILVIAPHPDDESLMSAGIIYSSLQRGEEVKVAVLTNGDMYGGAELGLTRQGELIGATVGVLGMKETDVIFLGYPDGGLRVIYDSYPSAGDVYSNEFGMQATYGNRGLGGVDYHSYRFGSPAAYNKANILEDLQSILLDYQPDKIFVTAEYDLHDDHAAAYYYLTDALRNLAGPAPGYQPMIHKAVIHTGDDSWPNPVDPTLNFVEPATFYDPAIIPLAWDARESIATPWAMQTRSLADNLKYTCLAQYATQLNDFIINFIHRDEIFWAENLYGDNRPPVADPGARQSVQESATVVLDGSASLDPEGAPLSYLWTQVQGPAVLLSNPSAPSPSFTAPAVGTVPQALTFQLVVSDGQLASLPNTVVIVVRSAQPNHPPQANAGAAQTVPEGTVARLDGTASSDPDGNALSYRWSQLSGPQVPLSDPTSPTPSCTAPFVGPTPQTLMFALVVSDGEYSSAPATVSLTVAPVEQPAPNIAPLAAVTASSENASTAQLAVKAVDTVQDGYPGDYTREWATEGQQAGAWIQLDWPRAYTVNRVVLYDRPNLSDQILGATLTFSDGSSQSVGPLANDGSGNSFSFPDKTVTWVRLTVDQANGGNVGLAEFEVNGTPVHDSTAPTAVITAPDAEATVGGTVQVSAAASDDVGVSRVEFYVNGALKAVATAPPYSFSWDTTLLANGSCTLSARALDTANNSGQSAEVTVTVANTVPDTTAPTVTITAPSAGATVSGTATLSASASDDVGVTRVEFYVNGILKAAATSAPYSYSWDTADLASGSYTLSARAFDAANHSGQSAEVVVQVAAADPNIAPLATVTASSENTSTGQLAVKAVDTVKDGYPGDFTREWATVGQQAGAWIRLDWPRAYTVNRVVLYDRPNLNEQILGATLTFSDGSSLSLGPLANDGSGNSFSFPDKTVTWMRLTVTQASGGNVGLAELEVNGSPVHDSTAPTAAITAPGAGATVGGTVQVSAAASDDLGVARVEFYVDGLLKASTTSAPYRFSWDTTSLANGSCTLSAKVYDVAGNSGQSAGVTVTVSNSVPDTTAPTVSITAPAAGASVSGTATLSAVASDDVGVTRVEFYVNGVLKAAATSAPYSYSWDTAALANGSYTLSAKAFDAANHSGQSAAVLVSVANPNIAPLATVTASSENTSTGQLAVKAVDTVRDGYPGDYTKEWATVGQQAGAWIQLDWHQSYTVNGVMLYDRPNLNDQILGATLTFSDGSSVSVGPLANDGSGNSFSFPDKTVTWVRLTVTQASGGNVGLAEFVVRGTSSTETVNPSANAGTAQTVSEGAVVTLDGSASSAAAGHTLAYRWSQSQGTPVVLSDPTAAAPSFTAPLVGSAPQILTFQLVVADGELSSTPATVAVTVVPTGQVASDIAPLAVVSASSENTSTGQLAQKAVDTVKDGYPGDYTREWATTGQGAGAWIMLNWSRSYAVDKVVLYDRPNLNDQILSATLTFSDGSSLSVGPLTDNGNGDVFSFAPRYVSWVRLTVNQTRGGNTGLAEFEIWGR